MPLLLLLAFLGCDPIDLVRPTNPITNSTNDDSSIPQDVSDEAAQATSTTQPTAPIIGVNLDNNADWMTARIWVDARKTFRPWGRVDRPWEAQSGLQFTPDGYPLSPAATMAIMASYPDGIYKLSYEGTGEIQFAPSSIAQFAGRQTKQGRQHVADVRIKHNGDYLLHLILRRVDARDPVRNMRLLLPGYPLDTQEVCGPEFMHRLSPFKYLRFMDWLMTNDNPVKDWNDRTHVSDFLAAGPKGVAYEDIAWLCEKVEKDLWINIPDQATDDYVRELARFLRAHANEPRQVYVEYSNELWNGQFQQFHRLIAAAKANPRLTKADDFGRAGEQVAFRLAAFSRIFHEEFKEQTSRVHLVFGGQAVNTYFVQSGLEFMRAAYGEPNKLIDAIAIAPYLGNSLPSEVDKPGLTLDELFGELDKHLAGEVTQAIRNHRKLAEEYGLRLMAYEAGQHLTSGPQQVNEALKRKAQYDPRMGALLKRLVQIWTEHEGSQFTHFSHIGPYTKYGYWGLLEDIRQPGSVKWDAILSAALPAGDANLDGIVGYDDFVILRNNFGRGDRFWEQGDFNQDRQVDGADFQLLKQNMQLSGEVAGKSAEQLAEIQAFAKRHDLPDSN